ncbi:unnamed protein product [Adineta ricciae]|uniref:Uncharacterized protein n=1 Tax=Adineta ricciae TaxID=249248 RepID=A0A814K302_ADIRI|nr:unnamed protein product [Adineta ricciae]CAF1331196.1 unnamed protein product [Adineta ricciae]
MVMTVSGTLLTKPRLSPYNKIKSKSYHLLKRHYRQTSFVAPRRCTSSTHFDNIIMSKALIRELDLKMQQVKEYGLITHGYHNENIQYPVHVRRSHDGERVPRAYPRFDKYPKTDRLANSTILTSSSHENQTSLAKKRNSTKRQPVSTDQQQRTFLVPPNKTVNDIDPSLDRDHTYTTSTSLTRYYYHRKSSSSSTNSSPILCSLRPHSIACLSTTETITTDSCESTKTDEQASNLLSNSSQSLINQSTSRAPIRTITQKFFSKLFHNPSKS